jgi:hypothetical protein
MNTEDIMNKKKGTIESKKLEAKPIKIVSVRIQEKTKDGKEMKSPLVHLECKHPDKEELISLTKVKLLRSEKVITVGMWVSLDSESNFQKGSAVTELLDFLKCETFKEVEGKDIDTVMESETSQFLCLKAY